MAAILDSLTGLASISCWYQYDARQDEFRLKLLYCEARSYDQGSSRWWGKKKHTQISAIKQQNTASALFLLNSEI